MAFFAGVLIPLSLLLDIYIYFTMLRRQSGVVKLSYALTVVVIYLLVISPSLFAIKDFYLVVWLLWPYFLFTAVKAAYVVISLIGYLLSLFGLGVRPFRIGGVLFASLVAAVMLLGTFYGRTSMRVENIVVQNSKIPSSFDGYRIAFFSDLHAGSLSSNRTVKRLVERVNQSEVDLVIFGGDLVNSLPSEIDDNSSVEVLSGFRSADGVYSVLGNHDLGIYLRDTVGGVNAHTVISEMLAKQADMGWHTLTNSTVYISREEDSIALSGVMFPSKGRNNALHRQILECDLAVTYDSVPDTLFNLVVSHTPELWPLLTMLKGRADLTLSGHTHAMQSKIQIGPLTLSPASLIYRFFSGLYQSDKAISAEDIVVAERWAPLLNAQGVAAEHITPDKLLYVNDGFGYVLLPMRIGCRPELTMITLKAL